MTDTVTRLMGLIEAYRTAGGREEHWARKDALEAELTRLFTPLSDEQIAKYLRDDCIYTSEDICSWSFDQGVRWAEKQHNIGGES